MSDKPADFDDAMTAEERGALRKAFDWALSVDVDAARKAVVGMRAKKPYAANKKLAKKIIARYRWLGGGSGFVTGLPSNPFIAAPVSLVDMSAMLRAEVVLASRIALIYDEHFFDEPDAVYELLIPVFGGGFVGEAMKDLAVGKTGGLTRKMVRKGWSKSTLSGLRSLMVRTFGKRVVRRALFAKTVPVIGGVIGGVWNMRDMRAVGLRVVDYFEGLPLRDADD